MTRRGPGMTHSGVVNLRTMILEHKVGVGGHGQQCAAG